MITDIGIMKMEDGKTLTETEIQEFLNSLLSSNSDLLDEKFFSFPIEGKHAALTMALRKFHCSVTFTKVDGSIRTMPCTLRYESLPLISPPQTLSEGIRKPEKKQRPFNPNVISVWCLDKQEWRSFKVMNVISVKRLDESVE